MNLLPVSTTNAQNNGYAEKTHQQEEALLKVKAEVYSHRPERAMARLMRTHKMSALARIEALLDADTWRLFLGDFVCLQRAQKGESAYAAGVFCVLGTVSGRHVMVIANDNTQNAGAWVAGAPEKIVRAQNTAYQLGLPILWLIECPGLYLPSQDLTYAGANGAGAIFEHQVRHNRARRPQLAAVFGDCVAGGGYLPIFCDRVIMTEQATICIGGTALNKYSKAGQGRLGGPEMHVHGSGCADERVPGDVEAIARLRALVSLLPTSGNAFCRVSEPLEPAFHTDTLYGLLPPDNKKSFDVRHIIARLVDASLAEEIEPEFAPGIYACRALVSGLKTVLIANQPAQMGSILSRQSIEKMTRIAAEARACGTPVVWIQDVSGFDIGPEAEREGLLRYGTNLLRTLTQEPGEMPHLTILLRKAAGAGYYAMKGRPFSPSLLVATTLARLEVMSPEVLASTMYDSKIERAAERQVVDNSSSDLSTIVDNPEVTLLKAQKKELLERQIRASLPECAEERGDIDAVVQLSELRKLVTFFVEAAWQTPAPHFPR